MNEMNFRSSYNEQVFSESLGRYTAKTFAWMFMGLMLTFLTAIGLYTTGAIVYVLYVPYWHYALMIAEVAVVLVLCARIQSLSVGMARFMFFLYSALNGLVFSAYFLIFDLTSLWLAFAVTALFFGVMALIGYFGNINFSALRPFMTAALFLLLGFWVVSIFVDLSSFETTACALGIFIFLIFTAYDTRKIQDYYAYYGQVPEMAAKASIFAALALYLDFINLFLYLLRFMGRRRN